MLGNEKVNEAMFRIFNIIDLIESYKYLIKNKKIKYFIISIFIINEFINIFIQILVSVISIL